MRRELGGRELVEAGSVEAGGPGRASWLSNRGAQPVPVTAAPPAFSRPTGGFLHPLPARQQGRLWGL